MKDQRLDLLLASVREIDQRIEGLVEMLNALVRMRQRLINYEEHGIGFAGTSSFEDGPEVEK